MEKEILKNLIDKKFSFRQISKDLNISLSAVRYWSKKYNLKSRYYEKEISETKYCKYCETVKKNKDFYVIKKNKLSAYCKKYTNIQTVKRQKSLKEKCVEYKGGKCEICGYNKCISALEFHHINPNEKDFQMSKYKRYVFNEKVKEELDKCVLLCANCHREEHSKLKV